MADTWNFLKEREKPSVIRAKGGDFKADNWFLIQAGTSAIKISLEDIAEKRNGFRLRVKIG